MWVCSCSASTNARNWHLKTKVWNKCVITTWNMDSSTCSAANVATNAASVWMVRFRNWWQQHSSKAWNEHATIMFTQKLGLFHLIIILWVSWDVTFCNWLLSNSKQNADHENVSKKQGTNFVSHYQRTIGSWEWRDRIGSWMVERGKRITLLIDEV